VTNTRGPGAAPIRGWTTKLSRSAHHNMTALQTRLRRDCSLGAGRRGVALAVANRNFIIHQYDEINRELTWLTLSRDLPATSPGTLRQTHAARQRPSCQGRQPCVGQATPAGMSAVVGTPAWATVHDGARSSPHAVSLARMALSDGPTPGVPRPSQPDGTSRGPSDVVIVAP